MDKEQERAIKTPLKPVLVVASAGTGKTKVLTERIIYLIENNLVKPENILAITFTNLAAAEMKERVQNRLKDISKSPSFIGTIHAFFGEILRRDIEKVSSERNYNFEILDEEGQERFLRRASRNLNCELSILKIKTVGIRKILSDGKLEKFLNKSILSTLDLIRYKSLFEEYENILNKENYLDFDDVLILSYRLFEEFVEIRRFGANKYTSILVDECQDLNEIQGLLINKLLSSRKCPNFFAVGDPNQCIYIFNGAKETIFEEMRILFHDLEIVELITNYRSSKSIVSYSNEIKQIKNKNSVAYRKEEGEVLGFNTLNEILDRLLSISDYRSGAILFSKHSDANKILDLLIDHKIPFRISKFLLLEDICIEKIVKFLQVIFFDNSAPLEYLIKSKDLGLSSHVRQELTFPGNIPFNKTLLDFLINSDEWRDSPFSLEELKKLEEIILKIRSMRSKDKSNIAELAKEVANYIYPYAINSLSKKINLFIKGIGNIQKEYTEEESAKIILNLKNYAELSKEEITKGKHSSITLSTIHKTKGLEGDNVIILEYDEILKEAENVTESKHLSYVAVTRSKKRLFLIRGSDKNS